MIWSFVLATCFPAATLFFRNAIAYEVFILDVGIVAVQS